MSRLLSLLLVFALAACATRTGTRDVAGQRLAMFEQVVFSQEYDEGRSRFLAKWTSPLRIALKGKKASAHKATVAAHAKTLAALSGLDIALATGGKPANVTIFFASLDDMEHLAGPRIKNKKYVIQLRGERVSFFQCF